MTYIRTYLFIFIIGTAGMAVGQDHPFYVYGEVWDLDTRQIILNSAIKATDVNDSTITFRGRVDAKGRYDLELPFDHAFKVEFLSPGYVSKHVLIDLHGVDVRKRNGDHGMNIQTSLFRPLDELDYSILSEKAFGVCKLNSKGRSFIWDKEYAELNDAAFQKLLDHHVQRRKFLDE